MEQQRRSRDPRVIEPIARDIVDASIQVHREFGPGVYEEIYENAMRMELMDRGREVQQQLSLEVFYRGRSLGIGCRLDLVVDDLVVIEGKAVEKIVPRFKAQLLSYLKIGDYPLGLLLNFHEELMRHGITRVAYDYYPDRKPST